MTVSTDYPVLLFHSVDDRDLPSLRDLGNIRPEVFERMLVVLKKEFDILSLEDMIGCISGGKPGPERPLAVTFDDGASSYASHAVPVMAAHGMPSSCFLITDCAGDRSVYWRYLYNYCVHAGLGRELEKLVSSGYGLPAGEGGIIRFTRNNFSREKTGLIVGRILSDMVSEEEYREREGRLFLSYEDIKSLKGNPLVTFGIHTRSHPVMMGLSDEEIRDEISGSLDFYRKWVGSDVPVFSIPFGRLYKDYDERTVNIAHELSVKVILSAYGGCNGKDQPLYNIRRIPVQEDLLREGPRSLIEHIRSRCASGAYVEEEARLGTAVGGRASGRKSRP